MLRRCTVKERVSLDDCDIEIKIKIKKLDANNPHAGSAAKTFVEMLYGKAVHNLFGDAEPKNSPGTADG